MWGNNNKKEVIRERGMELRINARPDKGKYNCSHSFCINENSKEQNKNCFWRQFPPKGVLRSLAGYREE